MAATIQLMLRVAARRHAALNAVIGALLSVCLTQMAAAQLPIAPSLPVASQFTISSYNTSVNRGVAILDDLDADGRSEILIGCSLGVSTLGYIVYSSQTLAPLYQYPLVGTVVTSLDDVNGDGTGDFAMGATAVVASSTIVSPATITVASGATGSVLYSMNLPDGSAPSSPFLQAAESIVDLGSDYDGDGRNDFAFGSSGTGISAATPGGFPIIGLGMIAIVSGATGSIITQVFGTQPSQGLGAQIAAIGDVDFDGYNDLGAWLYTSPGQAFNTRNVWIYRCTPTGMSLYYSYSGVFSNSPTLVNAYPEKVAAAGDVDRDGYADFMIGGPTSGLSGFVEIRSGQTGAVIRTLVNPTGTMNNQGVVSSSIDFGRWFDDVGDIDGDGWDDHAVSAGGQLFFVGSPPVSVASGAVYVFSGSSGSVIFELVGNGNVGASLPFPLAGRCNWNGDGFADLVGVTLGESNIRVYAGTSTMSALAASGNVNAQGAGGVTDVLGVSVAGAPSPQFGGLGRTATFASGSALELWLTRPPGHSAPFANHVLFAKLGAAAFLNTWSAPFGIGSMCVPPAPVMPSDPSLFVLASTFGGVGSVVPAITAYAGVPGAPAAVTPAIPFGTSFIVQGLIEDSTAGPVPISVTNALRIVVL